MKKLHPTQTKLLKLLKNHIDNPLSVRELGELLDIESKGVVHHHILQLEKKGYLKRNPNDPRDYVIMDSPEKAVMYVNNYGEARCGPGGGILDGIPVGKVAVPTAWLRCPASEAFIVKAVGDSMRPKINAGDIVIARKQRNPEHGDIVVCVYKYEVLIKQYLKTGDGVILYSLNPDQEKYPPRLIIHENDCIIEGVMMNVLTS